MCIRDSAWIHPRIAVRNARKITDLNAKEEDIIIKHMWGCLLYTSFMGAGDIQTYEYSFERLLSSLTHSVQ